MTPKEVLNQFNSTNPLMHGSTNITNRDEYFEMIKQALEKQIPTKPTITVHRYLYNGKEISANFTHCPCCFGDIRFGYFDTLVDKGTLYCRRCGQRLDWSDNNA